MYIVHLTTELAPLAKVGGLGDVTAGLSKALIEEGEKVEVILPFYDHIDRKLLKNLKVDFETLLSYENLEEVKNTVWSSEFDGISLILIKPHSKVGYFERGVIYGEDDDLSRFTYFTKTAMEYLLRKGKHPDILNIHDWLTSLAAPLYREIYKSLGLKIGKIMTTIHNMKYQGTCAPQTIERLGLKTGHLITKDKMQDHKNPKKLNLLKGALVYSDSLTTVSPTYAKEIQGKEGFGLDSLLVENKGKLRGILNGIDTSYWNPETDPLLEENYQADGINLDEVIEAKTTNRKALQKKLNMDYGSAPLFISVTRIVEQKGPEMMRFGVEYVLEKGGQFIFLGSTPEPTLKEEFYTLAKEYCNNPHVHFHFIFDEELAHLTFASADCIIIPSLFEPCGLTQMISLRYGTIPIVHKVGGLNDTVLDIDHNEIPLERRNGYSFDFPSKDSLRWSIDRAFEHHKNNPKKWRLMLKNGFQKDWSWKTPALKYLEAYRGV